MKKAKKSSGVKKAKKSIFCLFLRILSFLLNHFHTPTSSPKTPPRRPQFSIPPTTPTTHTAIFAITALSNIDLRLECLSTLHFNGTTSSLTTLAVGKPQHATTSIQSQHHQNSHNPITNQRFTPISINFIRWCIGFCHGGRGKVQ